jgi:hypothetical protein
MVSARFRIDFAKVSEISPRFRSDFAKVLARFRIDFAKVSSRLWQVMFCLHKSEKDGKKFTEFSKYI